MPTLTTYNRRPPSFPKPKSVVDEIIDPTIKPMAAAVPSLEMATPVPTTPVKPVSPVDEIIAPTVVPQPTTPPAPVVEPAAVPTPQQPPIEAPSVEAPYAGQWGGRSAADFVPSGDPRFVIPKEYAATNFQPINASGDDIIFAWSSLPIDQGLLDEIGIDFNALEPNEAVQKINQRIPQMIQSRAESLAAAYFGAYDPNSKHPSGREWTPEERASWKKDVATRQASLDRLMGYYTTIKDKLTANTPDNPPPTPTPEDTTVPDIGTGGTPGQGGTTTPPPAGSTTTTTPPPTTSTPFKEGDLTKTAQQRYDDFAKTSPADYAGGAAEWIKERNRLRDAAKAEGGTTTPTGSTAIGEGEELPGADIATPSVDTFLKNLVEKGYELSAEEEATIRRGVQEDVRKALSAQSARGLGRSSEAAGTIAAGAFEETRAVGEAKARVRKEGTEAGLKAAELVQRATQISIDKTNSDRNYQLAVAGHNLADLKNAQDVSFQDRAMQLKTMESKAAIAQMEKEFGLKIDELNWKKFIETGELDAKILDITGTQRLNEIKIVNDYWLAKSDLELQEELGISKLELQKWMAGEEFDIARASQALERTLAKMNFQVERAKIEAALQAAGSDGWEVVMGILGITAQLAALA